MLSPRDTEALAILRTTLGLEIGEDPRSPSEIAEFLGLLPVAKTIEVIQAEAKV